MDDVSHTAPQRPTAHRRSQDGPTAGTLWELSPKLNPNFPRKGTAGTRRVPVCVCARACPRGNVAICNTVPPGTQNGVATRGRNAVRPATAAANVARAQHHATSRRCDPLHRRTPSRSASADLSHPTDAGAQGAAPTSAASARDPAEESPEMATLSRDRAASEPSCGGAQRPRRPASCAAKVRILELSVPLSDYPHPYRIIRTLIGI